MRRLLASAVLVAAVATAAFLTTGASDDAGGKTYKIVFDNAFGLVAGGDFKVGGVRAGQTTSFKLTKGYPPKAVVTAKATEPGFDDLRKDATCSIRPQSLIGEYFVDCQPGSSPEKLPDGGVLPVNRTEGTVNQDLINDVMRRPYRERLRLIISDLGAGLAGNPDALQEVLRRAHPGLRETSKVLRILGEQNRTIQRFIVNSDTVIAALERRKRDVARWVDVASKTSEVSASRSGDIARTFERFPTFLDELRPTVVKLRETADQQVPLLTDLRRAAPSFNTFVRELRPFSRASLPSLRALGRASAVGNVALRHSRDEIDALRRAARYAPGLAKPLRQFLQTLDDRDWSVERDRTVDALAPPPPDPNSGANGRGQTGFESILSYVYHQTTSISAFDQVSHMLRVVPHVSECVSYRTGADYRENRALYDRCQSWQGPYQPGVNQPDPTAGGAGAAARALARDRRPAKRRGERRGPGQPEAGPLPGQRDLSKPHVVLPEAVRKLVEGLRGRAPAAPSRPAPDEEQVTQLLDFLLAP
jgi:phospholipid/cholesterol/gamma-HCH transport system substrate-binding protein